ncbi:DUF2750 domain-containing protein [Haliea sp. E17]|uniref:DUF2750 domain-containing protein n=1 Tax=Haliea sp. E17 TaxID=3401576 RepID=UPI003AABC0AB
MRYSPYAEETAALAVMSEPQLLEYFLTRVFETEEVWGLDDGCEWVMQQRDEQWVMPLWPYRQFAEAAASGWSGCAPSAESLEDFVYQTLGALIDEDTLLEVMSDPGRRGCLVSPQRLHDIFTGMMNAGEYTLDS